MYNAEAINDIKKKYFSKPTIKVKDLNEVHMALSELLHDTGFSFSAIPLSTDGTLINIERIPTLDVVPEEYKDKEVPYGFYNMEDDVFTKNLDKCFTHVKGDKTESGTVHILKVLYKK